MPRNENLTFTYSSTTGALTAQLFAGGEAVIASAATFATSTTVVWEISINGGPYITLFDLAGNAISATASGALTDQYYHVNLPRCMIRPNVTAGTMTSGTAYVSAINSQT